MVGEPGRGGGQMMCESIAVRLPWLNADNWEPGMARSLLSVTQIQIGPPAICVYAQTRKAGSHSFLCRAPQTPPPARLLSHRFVCIQVLLSPPPGFYTSFQPASSLPVLPLKSSIFLSCPWTCHSWLMPQPQLPTWSMESMSEVAPAP